MKFKASKKQMKEGYCNIISIGYCEAQSLLYNKTPIAYSAGVYGWSCDYYDINGVLICTGYSPIGKHCDYKRLRKYEQKAQALRSKAYTSDDWQKMYKKIDKLLDKFINEELGAVQ